MLILLLVGITLTAMVAGRLALTRWFNHLSIYSAIWGSLLILVESKLIVYNPISGMAWFYIFASWLCLFLGSFTILFMRVGVPLKPAVIEGEPVLQLKNSIILFSLIGSIGIATQIFRVLNEFGSVTEAVFAQGNALYHSRLDNPDLTGISYVGAFAPAACTLAGMYAARIGKITITALIPLLLVAVSGILVMGRAGMMFAGIWFLAAFLHTPRLRFKIQKWQAAVAVILGILVLVGGFSLISATRGLSEDFSGESPSMQRASNGFPILPSLIFDYTAPIVGFSDYLVHRNPNDRTFWGMHTFAPIFRLASNFGVGNGVPYYDEFYYTPRAINVMTYLKDIHSDFGAAGVLIFPYALGALMTWLRLKVDKKFSALHVVILVHGYLVIIFSFAYNPMFLGGWYLSLALGMAACYFSQSRATDGRILHSGLARSG